MRKSLVSAGALLSVSAILLTGCTDNPKNNASSSNSKIIKISQIDFENIIKEKPEYPEYPWIYS